jgi:ATP-dependent helicase HepA
MWRWIPDWDTGTQWGYRFDFAVEARPVVGAESDGPLRFRADTLFPPLILTVWVDDAGAQITDAGLLEHFEARYRKPGPGHAGGDFALNRNRISATYRYIREPEWAQQWRQAEHAARGLVTQVDEFIRASATGLARSQADTRTRIQQFRVRAARATGAERVEIERDISAEQETGEALATAMRTPYLRLDSTGIVFLTGEQLDGSDDE